MSKMAVNAKMAGEKDCSIPSFNRNTFLQYWVDLTLDPDTANSKLKVFENKKGVERVNNPLNKDRNPKRFVNFPELLCEQGLTGKNYWEIIWEGPQGVGIAVSYEIIPRDTDGDECRLGRNTYSWSLEDIVVREFMHDNVRNDKITTPICSFNNRVGVYLDTEAGILQYFSVTPDLEDMTLLYEAPRSEEKFTEALFPGFWIVNDTKMTLCPKEHYNCA
ncbi:stonustoxin subunit alpha-like [Thunnus thynnus]|uniref:stonustoxin subunit alpha-like n=1 Tax=Thunnus thynnus TaxID=8237 RepID=UPI003528CB38